MASYAFVARLHDKTIGAVVVKTFWGAICGLQKNNKKIDILQSGETNFIKYCRYGIPLLENLHNFYDQASIAIKQKLLDSIFPAKLHFRDESYRTTPLNPALDLILQKNNNLENKKTGQDIFVETLSGEMPMTGLEPALCKQKQILNLPRLPTSPHRHNKGSILQKKIFFFYCK